MSVAARAFILKGTLNEIIPSEEPYSEAWRIFTFTRYLIASDPRDKIYSLLGLIRIGIDADYSKTVEKLYLEVSRIMFPRVPMG
jgi:hypothetical protein